MAVKAAKALPGVFFSLEDESWSGHVCRVSGVKGTEMFHFRWRHLGNTSADIPCRKRDKCGSPRRRRSANGRRGKIERKTGGRRAGANVDEIRERCRSEETRQLFLSQRVDSGGGTYLRSSFRAGTAPNDPQKARRPERRSWAKLFPCFLSLLFGLGCIFGACLFSFSLFPFFVCPFSPFALSLSMQLCVCEFCVVVVAGFSAFVSSRLFRGWWRDPCRVFSFLRS